MSALFTDGKDAPFVPTDPDVVQRVMKIAEVGETDVFYDLGSGDGRFVIAAAMKGASSYGVELDQLRVWYSRFWIWILRLGKNAKIINKDIFDVDFSNATVVCLYLLQETNNKIQKKLEKELKPGTRVVSVAFEFEDWIPEKTDPRGVIYGPLRLYIIP
jgi:16S rRNA A1518/A1519 N6-dimethyltransferase RsmA/KsgA/DIM1 with predicted DNA glycosylase/AP lyase activity